MFAPRLACTALLSTITVLYPGTPRSGDANQPPLIYDTSPLARARDWDQRYSDQAKIRALKAQALIIGDHEAALRPGYPNNRYERSYFMRESLNRATADYGLQKWQGSGPELFSRFSSAGTITYLANKPGLGAIIGGFGPLSDDAIKSFAAGLDQYNVQFRQEVLTPDQVVGLNSAINQLASQDKDLYAEFDKDLAVPGYDYPAARDPGAQRELELQSIRDSVQAQQKILNEYRDDSKRLGAMVNQYRRNGSPQAYRMVRDEALRQMKNQADATAREIKEVREWTEQQRQEERRQIQRENISGPFYALAQIAHLGGDQQMAATFQKFGILTDTVSQLSTMTASFAQRPYLYVNLYLAAATTALDLFQKSRGRSELAQVMEGLKQISEQIELLRIEMHKRFDALELRMGAYFHYTFVDLNQIQKSQESLRIATNNLQRDLADLDRRVDEKFEQTTRNEIRQQVTRCRPIDPRGKVIPLTDQIETNVCVSHYLGYAAGSFSRLVKVPDFRQQSYETLVDLVNPDIEQPLTVLTPPATYALGTRRLVDFLHVNPQGLGVARFGVEGEAQALSLSSLLSDGRAIDAFTQSMATKTTNDGTSLRAEPVQTLMKIYRARTLGLANAVNAEHVAAFSTRIPELARKWDVVDPPMDAGVHPLAHAQVTMCPGATFRVLNVDERAQDHRDGPVIDRRNANMRTFPDAGLPMNPDFLALLPRSLKWADYSGATVFNEFKINACLIRADVNNLMLDFDASTAVNARFEIKLTATYKEGETKKDLPVGRLVGTVNQPSSWADLAWSPNLATLIWSSPVAEGASRPLLDDAKARERKKYGLAGDALRYFHFEADPGLADLQTEYGKGLDRQKPDLIERLRANYARQIKELNETRWQMAYLLSEGLDMNDPRATALYAKLLGDTMVDGDVLVREMVEKSPDVVLDQLGKKMEQTQTLIDELTKVKDLKPAHSRIAPYVKIMEGLSEE